jgi:hypothetical protein
MPTLRCLLCAGIALLAAAFEPPQALAEPMDLQDPEPRWVQVRFERSPPDRPGQTNTVYSPPFAAWFELGERPGEVSVTVDGRIVEQHLLPDHEPRPGSFSDFVWIFDAETGHVRSAKVSGAVRQRLRLGLASWKVTARIRVEMNTSSHAGFTQPANLLGQRVHRFCAAADSSPCTLVPARTYNPITGYVNAVGAIGVNSGPIRFESFSPLGEAIFSELEYPLDGPWPELLLAAPVSAHVSSPPPASD